MIHYPHYIGDFRAGTFGMSRLERAIYRELLDEYYDTEQPLSHDVNIICRKIGAHDEAERSAVVYVLTEKFTSVPDGYRHERADAEIAKYHGKVEVLRANGKKGGRPTKKPNANQIDSHLLNSENQKDSFSFSNKTKSQNTQIQTQNQNQKEHREHATANADAPPSPESDTPATGEKVTRKRAGGKLTFVQYEEALPDGDDFIPADDPVFDYAESIGLPVEFLYLEWDWFRAKYEGSGDKYTDWRAHFRNAVRGTWGNLWGKSASGDYYLTTPGKQLQAEADARERGTPAPVQSATYNPRL